MYSNVGEPTPGDGGLESGALFAVVIIIAGVLLPASVLLALYLALSKKCRKKGKKASDNPDAQ